VDKKFVEELMNIKNIEEYPLDIPVNAELRSYQKEGINWMAFLNRYGLHGILCDDMGLGKTLQSICILAGTVHILRSVFVSILMTFL
jgi:TATA-binding protein-associated factor